MMCIVATVNSVQPFGADLKELGSKAKERRATNWALGKFKGFFFIRKRLVGY